MTPVLPFDQPLYWKVMPIKEALDDSDSIKKCVIRLGAYHQVMGFYSAIGYILQGSGLEELVEIMCSQYDNWERNIEIHKSSYIAVCSDVLTFIWQNV